MSTGRTTRAEAAQATADRLVAAARAAFAAQGFAAVSLDDLAARAGVTRGALHHRFGNKAGLFEEVVRRLDAEISAELDAVVAAHPDPWDGLRACLHAYLDLALSPERRRILFQDAPAVMGDRAYEYLVDSGLAEIVEALRGLAAAGRIVAPDLVAVAHVFNGASVNLAFWVAEDPADEGRRARAHETLALLFRGFEAPGAP